MAEVHVPRDEVVRLLGLSPDVDDETLQRELAAQLAEIEAQRVSAAERTARAEDRRVVLAAYNEGKIAGNRIEFWCGALQRDRQGNRAVLAALAPGLPPDRKPAADPEDEQFYRSVLHRLGVREPTRQVQAADQRAVSNSGKFADSSRVKRDDFGFPIPDFPRPQLVSRGKPIEEWTEREKADALQRQLGPRFYPGTNPPPEGDVYYWPSPNDPFEFDEASGQWREKRNYQAKV